MQSVRTLRDGTQVRHIFDEMTREKRAQDVGRDGSNVRFEVLDDQSFRMIKMTDAAGRQASYLAKDNLRDGLQSEPSHMHGADFAMETLHHGFDEHAPVRAASLAGIRPGD